MLSLQINGALMTFTMISYLLKGKYSLQLLYLKFIAALTKSFRVHIKMTSTLRLRKVYRHRIDALDYYEECDFIGRYRLDKATVRELAKKYASSQYISTSSRNKGCPVNAEHRVCMKVHQ